MTTTSDLSTQLNYDTKEAQALIAARACAADAATMVGLSFANRDMELITHLKSVPRYPRQDELPSPESCVSALNIELRWAKFVLEKVGRFIHKARLGPNIAEDVEHFVARPEVKALEPAARKLREGVTAFIGDSHMDNRHFSCNVPYPALAGSFLQKLGVGSYINAGIGGETARQGLARYQRDILDHKPARIVIAFGGNDLCNMFTIEDIYFNLERMAEQGHKAGADVVLGFLAPVQLDRQWYAGSWAINQPMYARYLVLDDAIDGLARRLGIPHVSLLTRLTEEHFAIDGVHLNQHGQEFAAIETLKALCGNT